MRKKNKKREIKKDQLLPEWDFIHFCNDDPANSYGGRMEINEHFLRAVEKDNLIKPFLQEEGKARQSDGTVKDGLVNYYSPHQIYLLAELQHNILDEDGNLRAPDTVERYKERPKEQRPRYISWGRGSSFWADNPKKRDEDEDNLWVGAHSLSEYLHSFLELLHSFEQPKEQERYYLPEEKRRYLSNAPILEYDFKPLKDSGKKLLKQYGLDEKKLIILRRNIGQFAEMTDPLAHWYYYIERHPEWKKDLLKGDASLAQELYRLYGLMTEVWEIIAKKKSEPIFEFIQQGFPRSQYPYGKPQIEYVHGEDIKALQYAIQQFKKWKRKKANKPFVSDGIIKKTEEIEKELADYDKRYGKYDRYQSYKSYTGGGFIKIREVYEENELKLEDLDEKTKWYVENTLKQIKDANIKQEISQAIEHQLWELKRELQEVFWGVSKQFNDRKSAAWRREQNFGNDWWMKNREKIKDLSREEQKKLANTERKKIVKEAKDWEARGSDFHRSVPWYADIVFCKLCREKPVRLHIENTSRNMWQVSPSVICDDCFANINQNSLTADDEWWKQTNQAEWKCRKCDKMLYKFAYGNMLSAKTLNSVPVKIEVAYGRATMKAKCPNPKCGETNERLIDWGWLP
ncbi:MAG: hypothetical protein Q8N09_04480 [Thermodesulfovibrionia bacterium]|nr:hypothetical protein [Thermodesulfovibrionia bacterium]